MYHCTNPVPVYPFTTPLDLFYSCTHCISVLFLYLCTRVQYLYHCNIQLVQYTCTSVILLYTCILVIHLYKSTPVLLLQHCIAVLLLHQYTGPVPVTSPVILQYSRNTVSCTTPGHIYSRTTPLHMYTCTTPGTM